MKKTLLIITIAIFIGFLINGIIRFIPTEINNKPPTNGTQILYEMEDMENHNLKKKWFKDLHKTKKGVSWKTLETANDMNRHQLRNSKRKSSQYRDDDESIANGLLQGKWNERGSNNQAGSVLATAFIQEYDEVWLVSAGGSLWKSVLGSEQWEIVNDDLQFDNRFLNIRKIGTEYRIYTMLNKIIHYSDDMGKTWVASSGLATFDSNWGSRNSAIFFTDSSQISFQLISEWNDVDWKANSGIYISGNNGESYNKALNFGTLNIKKTSLFKPDLTNDLYMLKEETIGSSLYQFNNTNMNFDTLAVFNGYYAGEYNLHVDSNKDFYNYYDGGLFKLNKENNTWEKVSDLPINPWKDAFYISPSNPNLMLCGAVECFKSFNGGIDWYKVNNWWDYYDDRERFLHADLMNFKEIVTSDGDNVMLISNHGGLNVSYDGMFSTKSISNKGGLNVGQFYSVRSLPSYPVWIFGGTQDQGFQRGMIDYENETATISMEQNISGDYGHIVFTQYDHLWTVYPGGWVILYTEPQFGNHSASWQLPNSNGSAWIPPLVVDPNENETIYLVGGSDDENGYGSYIHKLVYDNGVITAEQLPFEFAQESGGYVSAFEIDPINENNWYASTSNGLFYRSTDKGISWDVSVQVGPAPNYLYGTNILASELTEGLVYFGGSGYATLPMYKSVDGGEFFSEASSGMPSTVILDMCFNGDESMIFAATESGPYVYIVEENQWYDMSGMNAPTQTYWSVEYTESMNTIRFGTYGRGIWDFNIKDISAINNHITSDDLDVYPTLVTNILHVNTSMLNKNTHFEIYNNQGQLVKKSLVTDNINVSNLAVGVYHIKVLIDNKIKIAKFIKTD